MRFFFGIYPGNADRTVRLKKGRKSQPGVNSFRRLRSARNLDDTSARSLFATNGSENADIIVAAEDAEPGSLDTLPSPARSRSKREATASAGSRRLKLLVHTGSCRIVMTGEVTPESGPIVQDILPQNEDEAVVAQGMEGNDNSHEIVKKNFADHNVAGDGEVITVSQSVLLSSADHVHYSKQNDSSGPIHSGADQFV